MAAANTDRNLLFGILAHQMDFISRDTLVKAMHAWVLEKGKTLGEILVEQQAISSERYHLLEALVQEHLKQHGDDAVQSLAAVSSIRSVREELQQIADPELHASLAHVSQASVAEADSWETGPASVGTSTSSGLRFRILRPHARGGLGQVSVAHDEELRREVALKEIQNEHADNPTSRSRFVLEAEVTGGLEHPGFASLLAEVSADLLKARQFPEAEKLLRECLAIRTNIEPAAWTIFNTESMLGGALLGQKKYADAEPLLLAGYGGMKEHAAKIPPQDRDLRLQEATGRLAELFEATRTKDESKLQGKLTDAQTEAVHEFKLTAGKPAVIEMQSRQFDTLLRLQDAQGKALAENDDIDFSSKNLNSRLVFIPTADGVYRLIATSFQQSGRGEYEILIREYSAGKPK